MREHHAPPAVPAAGYLLLGAAVVTGCGVAFVLLAHLVAAGRVDDADARVLAWIAARRTPVLDVLFAGATDLGSSIVLYILALGIAIALWLAGRPGMGLAVTFAVTGGAVISRVIKITVARQRPAGVDLATVDAYAFPSGHTLGSIVFFVTIALLASGHVERRGLRVFLVGYALAACALVAASRLYLGVHYPSDVLGGALVGIGWSLTVVMAEHRWRHHRAHGERAAKFPSPHGAR